MQLEQYFRPLASGYNSSSEDVGRTSNENNNDTELNAPQTENAQKPQ